MTVAPFLYLELPEAAELVVRLHDAGLLGDAGDSRAIETLRSAMLTQGQNSAAVAQGEPEIGGIDLAAPIALDQEPEAHLERNSIGKFLIPSICLAALAVLGWIGRAR